MNCLYEAVADAYLRIRGRFAPALEDDLAEAEENLEACRQGLLEKERGLLLQCDSLARAALAKQRGGDMPGARQLLQVEPFFDV